MFWRIYLGGVCKSVSMVFLDVVYFGDHSIVLESHEKDERPPRRKSTCSNTQNCAHDFKLYTLYLRAAEETQVFNKTVQEPSLPGPSHLIRCMSSKAPLLPNRTPQTAAVPGLSKLPPASVSLIKQLAYLPQVIFQGTLLNLAHLSRLVQGTGKPQVWKTVINWDGEIKTRRK